MDTWIVVSYTQTLLDFVKQEMDGKINLVQLQQKKSYLYTNRK